MKRRRREAKIGVLPAAVTIHLELTDVSTQLHTIMIELTVFHSWTRRSLFCRVFYLWSLHSNFSSFRKRTMSWHHFTSTVEHVSEA